MGVLTVLLSLSDNGGSSVLWETLTNEWMGQKVIILHVQCIEPCDLADKQKCEHYCHL